MCKQLVEKDEVIDILKKIRRHSVETIADQCHCIQTLHRQGTPVEQACRVLKISRSGCYGRARHNPCARERRNQALQRRLKEPDQNDLTLGLDNLCHQLKPEFGCSRKRVHRRMRLAGIASVRCRACKVTTNSRLSHPSPPNLKELLFLSSQIRPGGDITCILTGEGGLYPAIVKGMCIR